MMGSSLCLLIVSLLGSTISLPQNGVTIPKIDFSSAHEVNNLEPSAMPEIEHRSYGGNNGNYLEATVEEVQSILRSNPELPRLTRGEIIDLLDNITKEDMEKLRTLNKNNRNGKAILLVMPYTPKTHAGEDMVDLFTKKPITQLIDNDDNDESAEKKFILRKKQTESTKKERVQLKTTTTTTTTPIYITTPVYITTDRPTIDITTYRPRTRPTRLRLTSKPVVKRRRTTFPPTTEFFGSTTMKFLPENAVRTRPTSYRRRPTKTTTTNPDLSPAESYVNNVYVKFEPNVKKPEYSSYNTIDPYYPPNQYPVFKPLNEVSDDAPPVITARPITEELMIPDDLKHLVQDLDLNAAMSTDSIEEHGFKIVTEAPTTTTTTTEFAVPSMPKFEEVADSLTPDMRNILMSFGLLQDPDEEKDNEKTEKLKDLSGYYPEKPQEHRDSYVGFKPLPEDGETNKEMDDLLASFGLGHTARRAKKLTSKPEGRNKFDFSVIPESMMGVVESLGLKEGTPIDSNTNTTTTTTTTTTTKTAATPTTTTETPRVARKIDRLDESRENETVSAEDISRINELYNEIFNETSSYFDDAKDKDTDISHHEMKLLTLENGSPQETTTKETLTSVVFNPTDPKLVPEEKDLNKLMSLIKSLKTVNSSDIDASINIESLKGLTEALNDSQTLDMESLKGLTEALNDTELTLGERPIDMESLKGLTEAFNDTQLTLGEQLSNEISPSILSETTVKLETTTESLTTTTNPDEQKSEIQLLEEGFAKVPDEEEEEDEDEEEETATNRVLSSGAYYLFDWNQYLEVDDGKGRHVNLRFQPTIGDPTRFYAIDNS